MKQQTIVAEVSTTHNPNRPGSRDKFTSDGFQGLIDSITKRGYKLRDWQFTSVPVYIRAGNQEMTSAITKTIVAVFELVPARPKARPVETVTL